jgi:hypothetical protein
MRYYERNKEIVKKEKTRRDIMNTKKLPPLNKEELEKYISDGLSSYEMSEIVGRGQTSVRWWLKKYGLKTNHIVGKS